MVLKMIKFLDINSYMFGKHNGVISVRDKVTNNISIIKNEDILDITKQEVNTPDKWTELDDERLRTNRGIAVTTFRIEITIKLCSNLTKSNLVLPYHLTSRIQIVQKSVNYGLDVVHTESVVGADAYYRNRNEICNCVPPIIGDDTTLFGLNKYFSGYVNSEYYKLLSLIYGEVSDVDN